MTASWPPMPCALAGVFIASLPSAIIGFALATVFRHAPRRRRWRSPTFTVMIVTAVVGLPLHFMRTPTARAQPPLPLRTKVTAAKDLTASKDLSVSSAFLRRIPANLGTELLYIEVEDHYLRVHTPLGSDLLLFRLADAGAQIVLGGPARRCLDRARRASRSPRSDHRSENPGKPHLSAVLREAGWL
jgi:hypothetical protein